MGDCFAGIGCGGLIASGLGLRWIGVELEPRFCDMASGCDCTGVTSAEWVRWFGRWDRVGYSDNRHWCPRCLGELGQVENSSRPLFAGTTAKYQRDSGVIPFVPPHRYEGNGIGVFQGDSRRFAEIVAGCDAIVTSPPYAGTMSTPTNSIRTWTEETKRKWWETYRVAGGGMSFHAFVEYQERQAFDYGHSPGQIGAMPAGKLDAVVTSPPFSVRQPPANEQAGTDELHGVRVDNYGSTPGQIGAMKEGKLDAIVTSPPFGDMAGKRDRTNDRLPGMGTHYGGEEDKMTTPGQIGAMKEGKLDAVVTSPPFMSTHGGHDTDDSYWNNDIGVVGEKGKKYSDDRPVNPTIGGDRTSGEARAAQQARAEATANIGCIVQSGNAGNLVNTDTYWQAVAQVYEQCRLALRPGGMLVVVVKAYVKGGKLVPLPDQTLDLLQRIGFEPVERIRAMLVKETREAGLFGEHVKRKERKSFFRLMAERKGSPRIDWEEVLCVRKGMQENNRA